MANILPLNRSNNVDKLHLLKMLFVQLKKQQWHLILKNVALLKDNDFVISQKSFQIIFMVGIFRKLQMPLMQILCFIFYVFSELWGWKKSSKSWKALCSFNKLMDTCINTIGWNTTNQ